MSGDETIDSLLDIPVPELNEPAATASPVQNSYLNRVRSYSRQAHQAMKEEEEARAKLCKKLGFGDFLREWSDLTVGRTPLGNHSVRANQDEHVLITCYSNFQVLVHVIDNRQMCTNGSRLQKVWKRECAPHKINNLVEETKKWLEKRAAKRAVTPKAV